MTKFEELGKSVERYNIEFDKYKCECINCAAFIRKKFAEYLECPDENVKFVRLQEGRPYRDVPLKEAMSLESDNFYHIGLGVIIYKEPNIHNTNTMYYMLLVKKIEDKFVVGLLNGKTFRIPEDNPDKLEDFFEYFFEGIKEYFDEFPEIMAANERSETVNVNHMNYMQMLTND